MQGAKEIAKMNSLNLHYTHTQKSNLWAKYDSVTAYENSVLVKSKLPFYFLQYCTILITTFHK